MVRRRRRRLRALRGMKKGRPRAALRAALRYFDCVVDEFGEVAPFVPLAEVDGALVPLEDTLLEGAALVPLDCELLAGALVPLDELLLEDGAASVPLDCELLPPSEELLLPDVLPPSEEEVPPDCWPHCCCAAWVRGPMMPSIGPGSQPCDLSCCCSWRTDSSPCCAPDGPLPEAALPLPLIDDAFEPCAEADELFVPELPEPIEDPLGLPDCEAPLVPLEEGLACAVSCGCEEEDWEACLSDVLSAAIAPVAAITAATRASLFISMSSSFCWVGVGERPRGQTTRKRSRRVPSGIPYGALLCARAFPMQPTCLN